MYNEKKLKEIVNILYIKELVGQNIYEKLNSFPQLYLVCEELADVAYNYEVSILMGNTNIDIRKQVEEKILIIHQIATDVADYRQSGIYFDEDGRPTGLF